MMQDLNLTAGELGMLTLVALGMLVLCKSLLATVGADGLRIVLPFLAAGACVWLFAGDGSPIRRLIEVVAALYVIALAIYAVATRKRPPADSAKDVGPIQQGTGSEPQ